MSPAAVLSRAVRRPSTVLAAAFAALLLAGAAAAGGAGAAALRAGLVLLVLGALAALARHRKGVAPVPSTLRVEARQPLGRDSGVALVRAARRRFLLGYGPGGATLVAELSPEENAP